MSSSSKDMLSPLSQFFSRYLSCSEDQRTILALWTLHIHCFAAAQTTPYLDISSTEWQSGKTVCLRLLSLLCADPWLATGINSTVLVRKLTAGRPALLLVPEPGKAAEEQTKKGKRDAKSSNLTVTV